ncbi:MAG: hypothetical protein ACK5MY_14435 [Jhaorihella sp.]
MHPFDPQERDGAAGFVRLRAGLPVGAVFKDNIPETLENFAATRATKAVLAGPEGRRGQRQSAQTAGHDGKVTKSLALTETLSVISKRKISFRQVVQGTGPKAEFRSRRGAFRPARDVAYQ